MYDNNDRFDLNSLEETVRIDTFSYDKVQVFFLLKVIPSNYSDL